MPALSGPISILGFDLVGDGVVSKLAILSSLFSKALS